MNSDFQNNLIEVCFTATQHKRSYLATTERQGNITVTSPSMLELGAFGLTVRRTTKTF